MNYTQWMEEAKIHETENVSFLAHIPDSKLERKLSVVREQMNLAGKNKQEDAVQLLKIWERRIIEARVIKL